VAKTDFQSVAEYIAAQPKEAQPILRRVRTVLRKALPDAEERISYQIPVYRMHGGAVIFFAGWKRHYSLYPANAALVAAFKDELAPYEVNDKGTIRFPLSGPVPVHLIARIAAFRAQEMAQRAKAKLAAPKRTTTKRR
jgi:uncharacterized protein YdhG (YjbR/CyaY superfamily)